MKKTIEIIIGIIFSLKLFGCHGQPSFTLQERLTYLQNVVDSTKSNEETKSLREGLHKALNSWIDSGISSLQSYRTSNYKIYEGVIYNKNKDKVLMFSPQIDIYVDSTDMEAFIGQVLCHVVFKINGKWVYSDNLEAIAFTRYEGISLDDMVEKVLVKFIHYENLVYPDKLEIDYKHLEERHFPDWLYKSTYKKFVKD